VAQAASYVDLSGLRAEVYPALSGPHDRLVPPLPADLAGDDPPARILEMVVLRGRQDVDEEGSRMTRRRQRPVRGGRAPLPACVLKEIAHEVDRQARWANYEVALQRAAAIILKLRGCQEDEIDDALIAQVIDQELRESDASKGN
jgi:hypothetical protein